MITLSQDIVLALTLFSLTNKFDEASNWVRRLVRNIAYAYTTEKYVPVCTDSLDDLAEDSGWNSGKTEKRLMNTSWMLPTLAGWCAILRLDDSYAVLAQEAKESYPEVCMQLWHPDKDIYQHRYFKQAQFDCGATEAPIHLPPNASAWREHMAIILNSDQAQIANDSLILQAGFPALDLIACRHFSTPIPPYFWYQFLRILSPQPNNLDDTSGK